MKAINDKSGQKLSFHLLEELISLIFSSVTEQTVKDLLDENDQNVRWNLVEYGFLSIILKCCQLVNIVRNDGENIKEIIVNLVPHDNGIWNAEHVTIYRYLLQY